MVIGRNFHLLIAAVLVCGLLTLSWISKSVDKSQIARLSVSGVEQIQKLDHRISNRLANEELAKWDKLESEIFPTNAHKSEKSVKNVNRLNDVHHKAVQPTKATLFFADGSGRTSTDARFRKQSQAVHVPEHKLPIMHVNARAVSNVRTQKKALEVNIHFPSNI